MTKEEAKDLYEGQYFYEIVKDVDCIKLLGPFDNIYYSSGTEHKYVQVIDGLPRQTFNDEDILVLDRKL